MNEYRGFGKPTVKEKIVGDLQPSSAETCFVSRRETGIAPIASEPDAEGKTRAMTKRPVLLAAILFGLARLVAAETVTLPLVMSGAISSDVRVFNTSYSDAVTVAATYRCTVGSAGCVTQPVEVFELSPRESRAFDDICVSLFGMPDSLGAVEFETPSGGLVVTSRVRSVVSTGGSVGMLVPGLPSSAAHVSSVLTGLSHGAFRTDVGVYNPNLVWVTATIELFEGARSLGALPLMLPPQSLLEVRDIYEKLGLGGFETTNGYATVESSDSGSPLFAYAEEADNVMQDRVLVLSASQPCSRCPRVVPFRTPIGPPVLTATSAPVATPTPTSPPPVTVIVSVQNFSFSPNPVTVHVGDTVKWNFVQGTHSTTSGACPPCNPDGHWDSTVLPSGNVFSHAFAASDLGTRPYYCSVHLSIMTGTVNVLMPGDSPTATPTPPGAQTPTPTPPPPGHTPPY